ncbi:MAG: carboxypeptidase regulatory-like domain-containing protein [Candidatus Harrisonbacteria bacterium]|nr:carboxypeptidase regulatory-like domain-containing protein [Candidatus Harrisonbacteria bacterium]
MSDIKQLLKIFSLFIFSAYYLLFTATVFAQTKFSQTVTITLGSPGIDLSNVRVVLSLPPEVAPDPDKMESNVTWDPASRELVLTYEMIKATEDFPISFTVIGPVGTYFVSGSVSGVWEQLNQDFAAEIPPFALEFVSTGIPEPTLPTPTPPPPPPPPPLIPVFEPEVVEVVKNVVRPVSVATAAVGAGAAVSSAFSLSAVLTSGALNMFSYLGLGFLRFRRRKPWGRVYNQHTKVPIANATVRVFEVGLKQVKETQITDKDGRFGFLVTPGNYYLKIYKRGFTEKQSDAFRITGPGQALNIEIPLLSSSGSSVGKKFSFMGILGIFTKLLNKIGPWILTIGLIFSLFTTVVSPTTVNFLLLGFYVFLISLQLIINRRSFKSFGRVLDSLTREPIDLAVVRIFDVKRNWLMGTRVTDRIGRFSFLINPGIYYLTINRDGYLPHQSAPLVFDKSTLISYEIKISRRPNPSEANGRR